MRDAPYDQTAPVPNLEEAVLALIFRDKTAIAEAIDAGLDAEHFTAPELGAAFLACQDAHLNGQPITAVRLLPRLAGITTLDGQSGLELLRGLTVFNVGPTAAELAEEIRQAALQRKAQEGLRQGAIQVMDRHAPFAEIIADIAKHLETIADDAGRKEAQSTRSAGQLAANFIEHLQSDAPAIEISIGLSDLDQATGGLHRKHFAIFAGRPSMGKSTLVSHIALEAALAGHGVLFFSLEMGERDFASRMITDVAYTDPPIAYSDLRPGKVPTTTLNRARKAAEEINRRPLFVDPDPGLTVAEIVRRTKKKKAEFEKDGKSLDCVFVDHLLKIAPSNRYSGNPVKELDEVSQAMCDLAKSCNVAVVGVHQLNRQNEDRDNQRALMSDLRGSGSLEQDADEVFLVYRPAYRLERQVADNAEEKAEQESYLRNMKFDMECQIAKNRNGPTSNIELWCDMSAGAVRNKGFR